MGSKPSKTEFVKAISPVPSSDPISSPPDEEKEEETCSVSSDINHRETPGEAEPLQETVDEETVVDVSSLTPGFLSEHLSKNSQSGSSSTYDGVVPHPFRYKLEEEWQNTLDDEALKVKYRDNSTPTKVVNELGTFCEQKYELLRAIFIWITHLEIPTSPPKKQEQQPKRGKKGKNNPSDKVVKLTDLTQNSALSKYVMKEAAGELALVHLFAIMCKCTEIKHENVKGFLKTGSYRPGGDIPSRPNHIWSAVMLDNRWFLCDVTLGRRQTVDPSYFFMTHPASLIFTHHPAEEKWQLLTRPVSTKEFSKLVMLYKTYFSTNLELKSPISSQIEITDEIPSVTVCFEAPTQSRWRTSLVRIQQSFGQKDEDMKSYVAVGQNSTHMTCHIRCSAGEYELAVYRLICSQWKLVVKYTVISSLSKRIEPFPCSPLSQWGMAPSIDPIDIQPQVSDWLIKLSETSSAQVKFDIAEDGAYVAALTKIGTSKTYDKYVQVLVLQSTLVVNARLPSDGMYTLSIFSISKKGLKVAVACYMIVGEQINDGELEPLSHIPLAGLTTRAEDKFSPLSHKKFHFIAPRSGQFDMRILLKETDINLVCKIYYDGKDELCRKGKLLSPDYCYLYKSDRYRYFVTIRLPHAGYFRIQFYEDYPEGNIHFLLCSYYVRNHFAFPSLSPLTKILSGWNPSWQLVTPRNQFLEENAEVLVSIWGPPSLNLQVRTSECTLPMEWYDGVWSVDINVGPHQVESKLTPKEKSTSLKKKGSTKTFNSEKQQTKSQNSSMKFSQLKSSGKVSLQPDAKSCPTTSRSVRNSKSAKTRSDKLDLKPTDGFLMVESVPGIESNSSEAQKPAVVLIVYRIKPSAELIKENEDTLEEEMPSGEQEIIHYDSSQSHSAVTPESNEILLRQYRRQLQQREIDRKAEIEAEMKRLGEEQEEEVRMEMERKILSRLNMVYEKNETLIKTMPPQKDNALSDSLQRKSLREMDASMSILSSDNEMKDVTLSASSSRPLSSQHSHQALVLDGSMPKQFAEMLEAADLNLADFDRINNSDEPFSEAMKQKIRLQMMGFIKKNGATRKPYKTTSRSRVLEYSQKTKSFVKLYGMGSRESERHKMEEYKAVLEKLTQRRDRAYTQKNDQCEQLTVKLKRLCSDMDLLPPNLDDDSKMTLHIRLLSLKLTLAMYRSDKTSILESIESFVGVDHSTLIDATLKLFKELEGLVKRAKSKVNVISKFQALEAALDSESAEELSLAVKIISHSDKQDPDIAPLFHVATERLNYQQKLGYLVQVIGEMSHSEFMDVVAFSKPPQVLQSVVQAYFVLLGVPTELTENWKAMQLTVEQLGETAMVEEMQLSSSPRIELLEQAAALTQNISAEKILEISPPAVFLLLWVKSVLNHELAVHELEIEGYHPEKPVTRPNVKLDENAEEIAEPLILSTFKAFQSERSQSRTSSMGDNLSNGSSEQLTEIDIG